MSSSRRLDLRRMKNSFKDKSLDKTNSQPPLSIAEVYAWETPYHYDAIAMPMMKLPRKGSASDMRKRSASKSYTADQRTDSPFKDTNGHRPSTEPPLPPLPKASIGSVASPRSRSPIAQDYGQSYDLAPPPPKEALTTIDSLSERLFGDEHLHLILRDPTHFMRFTTFINKHRLKTAPLLNRYLETQKALKAIEYANAVADLLYALPEDRSSFVPCTAALLDRRFEERGKRAFETLVNDGLSAYVTRVLVDAVSDTMVKEITGNTLPIMRDLVGGLAEVFCLTDPSIKDNPIVYASEEFYRTTQYGRDYVIGRNCRFLQGPKTDRPTIARIKATIENGQEICETVLNYRRDGSPFLNLLMIAPLFDNRGSVRYFIGAQVDVTRLVEDGRGIDSFERLLAEGTVKAGVDDPTERQSNGTGVSKKPLETLGELGEMLSWEETMEIQARSRTASVRDDASVNSFSMTLNGKRNIPTRAGGRRVLGTENDEEADEKAAWGLSGSGLSGRLPGLYQNYLLVRPYPSLRIIFVSPALRIPGLLQSRFLSRIGGPAAVRDGIEDALAQGCPVTAKVSWLPHGRAEENGDQYSDDASSVNSYEEFGTMTGGRDRERNGDRWYHNGTDRQGVPQPEAKPRWLSCTPLLGSDDRVGVWMVVMIEDPNPGRVVGVRTADRNAKTNEISNSIGSISNGHSNGHTNGHIHHHHRDNSLESTHTVNIPSQPQPRRLKSPSTDPIHNGNGPPSAHPAPTHVRSSETLRASSTDAIRATQSSSNPTSPTLASPTSRTATLSTAPSLLHASKSTTAAENRARRNPPLGSWSPTLSAEAVESWIPTGYGGGMVGLVPGGTRGVEFHRGRSGGKGGGVEGENDDYAVGA
ncbi:hypothetical protein MMC30_002256 [Trapelia coarctata]|nr:hypothetical protein [Trapelia coarctata]